MPCKCNAAMEEEHALFGGGGVGVLLSSGPSVAHDVRPSGDRLPPPISEEEAEREGSKRSPALLASSSSSVVLWPSTERRFGRPRPGKSRALRRPAARSST